MKEAPRRGEEQIIQRLPELESGLDSQAQTKVEYDLTEIFSDGEVERFSEAWSLRRIISPYLDEYPFLAGDIATVQQIRDKISHPLIPPQNMYATGTFDIFTSWAVEERDRQIRTILNQAKIRHERRE